MTGRQLIAFTVVYFACCTVMFMGAKAYFGLFA